MTYWKLLGNFTWKHTIEKWADIVTRAKTPVLFGNFECPKIFCFHISCLQLFTAKCCFQSSQTLVGLKKNRMREWLPDPACWLTWLIPLWSAATVLLHNMHHTLDLWILAHFFMVTPLQSNFSKSSPVAFVSCDGIF